MGMTEQLMKTGDYMNIKSFLLFGICFLGASTAFSGFENNFRVYSCTSKHVADAGYKVNIHFDPDQKIFWATVYENSFFTETLLFAKPVEIKVMRMPQPGMCILKFQTAEVESASHFSMVDVAHSKFQTTFSHNGKGSNSRFGVLECLVDQQFIRKYTGCR